MTLGVGIDGCRAGWALVAVAQRGDQGPAGKGGRLDLEVVARQVLSSMSQLPAAIDQLRRRTAQRPEAILVDMPIGLPERDVRAVETLARQRPGVRAACVFNVPPRAVLQATDYDTAKALSLRDSGRRVSLQSWYIVPRIRDLDDYLAQIGQDQRHPREAHPELVWAALADGLGTELPLLPKRTAAGRAQRCAVLDAFGLDSRALLTEAFDGPRPTPAADDRLDAAVLALLASWPAAWRQRLPEPCDHDARGRPMEMVIPHDAQLWLQAAGGSD